MIRRHETHRLSRLGWLRAAVLGANDGIVSTASLVLGMSTAGASHQTLLATGMAGLAAGAMSMATGEYISVHSQADSEAAALAQEKTELAEDAEGEQHELTQIYVQRGLDPVLAARVAQQLTAIDPLGSHARDELGLHPQNQARPIQAAMASAASFAVGAVLPLSMVVITGESHLAMAIVVASLVSLFALGGLAAAAGGARPIPAAFRVALWSAFAMAVTAGVGAWVGKA